MDGEFDLFTSLRFDPDIVNLLDVEDLKGTCWNTSNPSPLYMLDFHRDRMLRAALHWNWQPAIENLEGVGGLQNLGKLIHEQVGPSTTSARRLRVTVSRKGSVKVETFPTPERPVQNLFPARLPPPGAELGPNDPCLEPQFVVLVDQTKTQSSQFTHFKTTRRDMYDNARKRAGILPTDAKEVLLVNEHEELMEGTITTPYFWRGNRWVTPPVAVEFGQGKDSGGQDGTTRRWALQRGLVIEQGVTAGSLVEGEQCWVSTGVRGFVAGRVSLDAPAS